VRSDAVWLQVDSAGSNPAASQHRATNKAGTAIGRSAGAAATILLV